VTPPRLLSSYNFRHTLWRRKISPPPTPMSPNFFSFHFSPFSSTSHTTTYTAWARHTFPHLHFSIIDPLLCSSRLSQIPGLPACQTRSPPATIFTAQLDCIGRLCLPHPVLWLAPTSDSIVAGTRLCFPIFLKLPFQVGAY
jgi:hypothetical protein